MRRLMTVTLIVATGALLGCNSMETQEARQFGPDHHIQYAADRVPWRAGPPSLEPGIQMAMLEGDPAGNGLFTMRLKAPDGYRIAPHVHPNYERITVISGTFHLGEGERFDRAAAKPLGAGSYTTMPPGMRHFAFAEGETVIQITTIGPWEIKYINPNDDPRNR